MASAVTPPPAAGQISEGIVLVGGTGLRYRIGSLLHRSETAVLHALVDEFGNAQLLKCYHPQAMQGEDPEQQWMREQQLLGRVRHPRVLALRDAFRFGSHCCLVLERADTDLERWLRQHGPLDDSAGLELARQLLDGLHAIHAAGILHLDLSPANVLVRRHGASGAVSAAASAAPDCLIADFGIGVLLEERVLLSRPPGHWAHLPPELLSPQPTAPTVRCDLYGLGITLLHARLGGLPVGNHQPQPELERRLFGGVLSQAAARLNSAFGTLVSRLLLVDPVQRPATALEAWRSLQQHP